MRKLNFCIVGAGRISTLNALGYQDHADAQIYAVCDTDRERAQNAAAQWGAAKVYTSYADALADPEIDAVELLVPHHLHCEMVVRACEAGKHVSVQKPMALSIEECDIMIAAARTAGVKLKVYENFIFYPPLVKAKQLMDEGVIGEPLTMRYKLNFGKKDQGWDVDSATWGWRMDEAKSGGGALVFDDGYHKFSVARHLMGEVERVFAWIDRTEVEPGTFSVDAPAMITWKYKGAAKYGFLDITESKDLEMATDYYPCDERVEVTGTKGVLWVTRCTAKMLQQPALIVYEGGRTTNYHDLDDDWADSFIASTKDFIEAIIDDRDPVLTGEDGREVLRFALGAMESSKIGVPVELP